MRRGECDMILQYRKYPCLLPPSFPPTLFAIAKLPSLFSPYPSPPTNLSGYYSTKLPSLLLPSLSSLSLPYPSHPPTLVWLLHHKASLPPSSFSPSLSSPYPSPPSHSSTNLSGCCNTEASSSTARALATMDSPGLETVHCWSRVRSLVDCASRARKMEGHSTH